MYFLWKGENVFMVCVMCLLGEGRERWEANRKFLKRMCVYFGFWPGFSFLEKDFFEEKSKKKLWIKLMVWRAQLHGVYFLERREKKG